MKNKIFLPLLAIVSGVLLTLMILSNSYLSQFTSPVKASWLTHGVGAIFSLIIFIIFGLKKMKENKNVKAYAISYLGGLPGAFTVLLAAITVNSPLSLSGSIVLMLVGQVIFGFIIDYFVFFNIKAKGKK
ncbi:transporter family-2 protein [Providencia alcalifaciens]|nr:transporter family-2 protein [Providencia alcalifaciens]